MRVRRTDAPRSEPRAGQRPAVAPFRTANSEMQWYGRFAQQGTVHVQAELTVGAGAVQDTITVTLSLTREPYTAVPYHQTRRLIVGVAGARTVDFGDVPVAAAGYVRLALSASGRGAALATVQALQLDGAAIDAALFNTEPRRNAASVHLRYPVDSADVVAGFYNEVVAVEDPRDTYYMATGFARGYFGMQVNSPTERRIIFSVWDAGNGTNANDRSTVAADDQVQLLATGDGVVAEVFGNEGTGGHSHLVVPWRTGEVQRFYVTAAIEPAVAPAPATTSPARAGATVYTGYWYDNDRRAWRLIASFRAPRDGQGLRRLYSFSEDFGGSRGHLVRKARFGPAWIRLADVRWRELTTATFSHDPTGRTQRLDRTMGVEDGRFFLQHGGFVTGFTPMGASFTRPAAQTPPLVSLPTSTLP